MPDSDFKKMISQPLPHFEGRRNEHVSGVTCATATRPEGKVSGGGGRNIFGQWAACVSRVVGCTAGASQKHVVEVGCKSQAVGAWHKDGAAREDRTVALSEGDGQLAETGVFEAELARDASEGREEAGWRGVGGGGMSSACSGGQAERKEADWRGVGGGVSKRRLAQRVGGVHGIGFVRVGALWHIRRFFYLCGCAD